jgi:hypothetical protein
VVAATGRLVAHVPGRGKEAANATLIAAAPTLYEALAELDDALEDGLCNAGATPDYDPTRLDRAVEAARKSLRLANPEGNA